MSEESKPAFEANESKAKPDRAVTPNEKARTFTFWQRVQIAAASLVGYLAVLIVGRSLRWEVYGKENWEESARRGKSFIVTFCHNQIFSAIWFWRQRGMVVLTSQNFDGEYITRIIQRHGYAAARGSSSRGGGRALVEMIRAVRAGREAAITVDGPRGPRFVVKPGVVLLARATGAAILCFHIAPRRAYVFRKSWDQTQIPYPFSRTAIFIAPLIVVPAGASDAEQDAKQQEVQRTLDELRARGEAWAGETS
jgi:lysophospholipid acyltransferase (LPLAT)-like uncharacterized protein